MNILATHWIHDDNNIVILRNVYVRVCVLVKTQAPTKQLHMKDSQQNTLTLVRA